MSFGSSAAGRILVGLDIGTSKAAAIIASVTETEGLEIIGYGAAPSGAGMKRGLLVNIDTMAQVIRSAVQQAEAMAGCEARSVWVGVSGQKIVSKTLSGRVTVPSGEVQPEDVERVKDNALAIPLSGDSRVLHILPKEYIVNGQSGVHFPVGMTALRLETNLQLITCAADMVENIERCVARCNLDCDGVVLEQLASAHAVLEEDERDLGVCLLDIGHGTTDIIVYAAGAVQFAATIPLAGSNVTDDVASAVNTTIPQAEEIKKRFGSALAEMAGDRLVEVQSTGNRQPRQVRRQILAHAIESRYAELFGLAKSLLANDGFGRPLRGGIVLTGGASEMPDLVPLAEDVFGVQARVGKPVGLSGSEDLVSMPACATGVGLLRYGLDAQRDTHVLPANRPKAMHRFMRWLRRHF